MQSLMPIFFSLQGNTTENGFLLDVSSIIHANNYRFNDSRYVILIVRKQNATGNLLLSIKQNDQGDWDNKGDYGDWNDWDYKDDYMAWMTGMTKDDWGSRLILLRMTRVTVITTMTEMTGTDFYH